MKELQKVKIFGAMGAALPLIDIISPFTKGILSIIGLILLLIALKYIADETHEKTIFKNYALFLVYALLAAFSFVIFAFFIFGGILLMSFFETGRTSQILAEKGVGVFILGLLAVSITAWILLIKGTSYLRISYNEIANCTKVDLFRKTGKLYLIGAITLIIAVGFFILFVAKILEIVSFLSLPDELPATPEPSENQT